MAWLDLEEGILEEFSGRAAYDANDYAREMLIGYGARTFRSKLAAQGPSECVICRSVLLPGCWTKVGHEPTCSKRCRQILRRRTLLANGFCPQCKMRMDRKGSICVGCCNDFANRWNASKKVLEMKRQLNPKSAMGIAIGDRVLVLGCSDRDTSDVYTAIAQFIGKRGRVVAINNDAPEVTVMFRKGRHRFRPEELSKMS